MAAVGELVEVDDEVEELRRLDRARVLLRTQWKPLIHHTVDATINGEAYQIVIVEEGEAYGGMRNQWARKHTYTSEDIDSDDINDDSVHAGMSANHDFLHPRNGINGEGWPDDAHNHCGSLPAGPTPVECPLGIDQRTMAPLLRIQIAKRPEEFQQPSAGYASTDVDPEITVAEASMRDSQKKKLNRSRGLLSGAESIEEEMFGEPDQGQKEDDIVFTSGPKNEPKMPHNILINMKKSVCEAGPSKQPPVSPNQQRNFRGSPPLLKNAYEQQATPSGLPTEMGLTKDTSASSNPQTNSKSCQKTSVVSEWKVFVRKKGSCHKQAQHRGEQCTQREVPLSVDTLPPAAIGSPEANGTMKNPEEEDIQEAESQWELAKSMGVHTELDQAAIINRITEMENRDKKEAAQMGNRQSAS